MTNCFTDSCCGHATICCIGIVYSKKAVFFMFGNTQNHKNVMVGLTYKEFSNQLAPDRRWKLYLIKDLFYSSPSNFQSLAML